MNEKTRCINLFTRTDLAYDDYEHYNGNELEDFVNTNYQLFDVDVNKNEVGKTASELIGKKEGTYYMLDLSKLNIHDSLTLDKIEKSLAQVLKEILVKNNLVGKKAFVVGLGNENVTPDAIGPYTIDNTIVTRHLVEFSTLSEGFTNVCAMSPGVMGNTGIETYDVIESMVKKVNADFLIVVDALATNSIKRINRTIQVTDTGIRPGSGIGNKRKELSFETLNIPVIGVGIPTVVDATTITIDAIQMVLKYLSLAINGKTSKANRLSKQLLKEDLDKANPTKDEKNTILGNFGTLSEAEQRTLVEEVLTPQGYNLIVTPKEIDLEVEDLSKIIANAINLALHPGLYNGMVS